MQLKTDPNNCTETKSFTNTPSILALILRIMMTIIIIVIRTMEIARMEGVEIVDVIEMMMTMMEMKEEEMAEVAKMVEVAETEVVVEMAETAEMEVAAATEAEAAGKRNCSHMWLPHTTKSSLCICRPTRSTLASVGRALRKRSGWNLAKSPSSESLSSSG